MTLRFTAFGMLLAIHGMASAADIAAPPTSTTESPAQPAAAPSPSSSVAGDRDAMVCRMVRGIGSNRASRVCRTKAQVDADAEAARNVMSGPAGDKGM